MPVSGTREYKLRWYHAHKEQARQYYAKNRDKILARERARAASKPPEVKRAYLKAWYEKNKVTQRVKNCAHQKNNRAAANLRSKAFALRHPERVQANQMMRRARIMGAQVGDSKAIADWMKVIRALPSFTCYLCQLKIPRVQLHFDHVIPLARGGKHSLDNMAASCSACNFSKNAKLPHELKAVGQRILSL